MEKNEWQKACWDINFEMKNSTCPFYRENISVNLFAILFSRLRSGRKFDRDLAKQFCKNEQTELPNFW